MKLRDIAILTALILSGCDRSDGKKIGEASTVFNLFGKNDRIEVESFADNDVEGISCYLSYAKKGGMKEVVGLEEDTSDASIACVQTAPYISYSEKAVKKPQRIFRKNSSPIFKKMQVMRYYDPARHVFSYLVYSDKVIEGSPKNSLAAVSCYGAPKLNPQTPGLPANTTLIGSCAVRP